MSLFPGCSSEKDSEAYAYFSTVLSTWLMMFIVGNGEKAFVVFRGFFFFFFDILLLKCFRMQFNFLPNSKGILVNLFKDHIYKYQS